MCARARPCVLQLHYYYYNESEVNYAGVAHGMNYRAFSRARMPQYSIFQFESRGFYAWPAITFLSPRAYHARTSILRYNFAPFFYFPALKTFLPGPPRSVASCAILRPINTPTPSAFSPPYGGASLRRGARRKPWGSRISDNAEKCLTGMCSGEWLGTIEQNFPLISGEFLPAFLPGESSCVKHISL